MTLPAPRIGAAVGALLLAAAAGCTTATIQDSRPSPQGPTLRGPLPPPTVRLEVEGAIGPLESDYEDATGLFDAEPDANRLRARLEGFTGEHSRSLFGVTVEGTLSETERFTDGTTTFDGRLQRGMIAPHFGGWHRPAEPLDLYVRVLLPFQTLRVKDNNGNNSIEWDGIGVRVEVEPELHVIRSAVDVSLFARPHVGFQFFEADSASLLDGLIGAGYDVGVTMGSRLRFQNLFVQVGYTFEHTFLSESSSSLFSGSEVDEMEFDFEGFTFGGGIVF